MLYESLDDYFCLLHLRPGLVGPHSVTGHANPQDWVCWLVRGLNRLKRYPEGPGCNEVIQFIPVDYVAQAVVHFSILANLQYNCKSFSPQFLKILGNWWDRMFIGRDFYPYM